MMGVTQGMSLLESDDVQEQLSFFELLIGMHTSTQALVYTLYKYHTEGTSNIIV